MSEKGESGVSVLTPREKEVLVLIGEGNTYTEAARKLRNKAAEAKGEEDRPISPRTVELYAAQIRTKLGIPLPPLRALILFYQRNREELGGRETWATGGLS